MWGDRAAVQMVQERMKLLLESHQLLMAHLRASLAQSTYLEG